MLAALPVLYFMFVVAGFLPLSAIIYMSLGDQLWGFRLFNALHVLVYGAPMYLGARFIARRLSALPPATHIFCVAVVLGLILLPAVLPIYGLGHSAYRPLNLYDLFNQGFK